MPEILLPRADLDLSKWAVVACDQYTSQPDYWQEVERIVAQSPSTLNLMLPELYLDKPDTENRIEAIRANMHKYIKEGVLESKGVGFVLVRRVVDGKTRHGLVMTLDLEKYDYNKGATSLIRATEGTIISRIPPRLKIRSGAPLEIPHILVLIDDPMRLVIEPLAARTQRLKKLYEFELMQHGGQVTGWLVDGETDVLSCYEGLCKLADKAAFAEKYGEHKSPMLFAMGDGNHSFATAKAYWEELKQELSEAELIDHPARYAMVEVENIHDEGIYFEPIHRVLFNVDVDKTEDFLAECMGEAGASCEIQRFDKLESCMAAAMAQQLDESHIIPYITFKGSALFKINLPKVQLAVGTLQDALDILLKEFKSSVLDYVHGDDVVISLGSEKGNIGFLLPNLKKEAFFPTVINDGAFPRKTFSMGDAHTKRFYLECRRI